MRRKQKGMTFLGGLILVTFVGLFVYGGIRLVPVYLEYMKVNRALTDLRTVVGDGGTSQAAIRTSLEKRFDIEDIRSLDWRDIEIARQGDGYRVRAAYSVPTRFVGNVDFLVHFDKTVEVPGR